DPLRQSVGEMLRFKSGGAPPSRTEPLALLLRRAGRSRFLLCLVWLDRSLMGYRLPLAAHPLFGAPMATATPSSDQPEAPRTLWDHVLTSTPIVMTVLATLLAGLSSSEMTQAQYFRSRAAQDQSKAGDQWGFFQAKRLRETILRTRLQALVDHEAFQP